MYTVQLLEIMLLNSQKSSSHPWQPCPEFQLSSSAVQVLPRASSSSAVGTSTALGLGVSSRFDDNFDGLDTRRLCLASSAPAPKDGRLVEVGAKAVVMAKEKV